MSVAGALCVSTVGGQNPGMIAGGGPKAWGEEEVPAEPGGKRFVQKGAIC